MDDAFTMSGGVVGTVSLLVAAWASVWLQFLC